MVALVSYSRSSGVRTRATRIGLRRRRADDHRPGAGGGEGDGGAGDGLVDQAGDGRAGEGGRRLYEDPARVGRALQQLLGVRQSLALVEVELHAVRAPADRQDALVPAPAGRVADDE